MPQPVFINKDAEFLHSLGDTFIADGDLETGMRLQAAARNLQALDDKYSALGKGDEFAAGVREAYSRIYERSNIPPHERTEPVAIAKALPAIRKIPMGVSGLPDKLPFNGKPKKSSNPKLAGLKLDLSSLMGKKE